MKIVVVHNTYQQPSGEDVAVAAERDLLESHGHTVIRYPPGGFVLTATRNERTSRKKALLVRLHFFGATLEQSKKGSKVISATKATT
jgi:hypothetical protein